MVNCQLLTWRNLESPRRLTSECEHEGVHRALQLKAYLDMTPALLLGCDRIKRNKGERELRTRIIFLTADGAQSAAMPSLSWWTESSNPAPKHPSIFRSFFVRYFVIIMTQTPNAIRQYHQHPVLTAYLSSLSNCSHLESISNLPNTTPPTQGWCHPWVQER